MSAENLSSDKGKIILLTKIFQNEEQELNGRTIAMQLD